MSDLLSKDDRRHLNEALGRPSERKRRKFFGLPLPVLAVLLILACGGAAVYAGKPKYQADDSCSVSDRSHARLSRATTAARATASIQQVHQGRLPLLVR